METKRFDLVHLLSEQKQNVLIWSAYCRNESKTICLFQGSFNYATHLFKVRKIGAKLIFFSLKYRLLVSTIRGVDDSPYHRCGELTTLRISDAGSRRLRVYTVSFSKSIKKRARLFAYSFFLSLYLMHRTGIEP